MVGIEMIQGIMCWITGRTEVVPSWRSSTPVTYGWLDIWEQHKVGRITLEPASLPKLPLRITLDLAICSVSQLGGEQSQPRLRCAWRAAANGPCLWRCRAAGRPAPTKPMPGMVSRIASCSRRTTNDRGGPCGVVTPRGPSFTPSCS
jgi:hypothetical protein